MCIARRFTLCCVETTERSVEASIVSMDPSSPNSPISASVGETSPTRGGAHDGVDERSGGGDGRFFPAGYPGYGPPGYPPHMASAAYGGSQYAMPPYGGGGPGGHPPPYGFSRNMPPYGYGGGYDPAYYGAPKHPSSFKSTRGGHHPTVPPPLTKEKSPESRTEEPPLVIKKVVDMEAERLKASMDTEISLSEVKPIKTDFHFFVLDMREKLRIEAEKEVADTAPADKAKDPYLINSNLNTRLMKAWEDLSEDKRDAYFKKEEADRRRFMEEDEVASRHCATLTARVKSPAEPGSGSPTRKSKKSPKEDKKAPPEEPDADADTDTPERVESPEKRPAAAPEDEDASPSKKNRADEESEEV